MPAVVKHTKKKVFFYEVHGPYGLAAMRGLQGSSNSSSSSGSSCKMTVLLALLH